MTYRYHDGYRAKKKSIICAFTGMRWLLLHGGYQYGTYGYKTNGERIKRATIVLVAMVLEYTCIDWFQNF